MELNLISRAAGPSMEAGGFLMVAHLRAYFFARSWYRNC
jgi:hypothetical protein